MPPSLSLQSLALCGSYRINQVFLFPPDTTVQVCSLSLGSLLETLLMTESIKLLSGPSISVHKLWPPTPKMSIWSLKLLHKDAGNFFNMREDIELHYSNVDLGSIWICSKLRIRKSGSSQWECQDMGPPAVAGEMRLWEPNSSSIPSPCWRIDQPFYRQWLYSKVLCSSGTVGEIRASSGPSFPRPSPRTSQVP